MNTLHVHVKYSKNEFLNEKYFWIDFHGENDLQIIFNLFNFFNAIKYIQKVSLIEIRVLLIKLTFIDKTLLDMRNKNLKNLIKIYFTIFSHMFLKQII